MKRPLVATAVALPFVVFAGACAYAIGPVYGGVYTKTVAPWSATTAAAPTKMGRACAQSILGIVATGDASIDTAKRVGGITTVSSVDFETTNVLFLYAQFCTIVRGT